MIILMIFFSSFWEWAHCLPSNVQFEGFSFSFLSLIGELAGKLLQKNWRVSAKWVFTDTQLLMFYFTVYGGTVMDLV